MARDPATVGVIGLGNMGLPMAVNLAQEHGCTYCYGG